MRTFNFRTFYRDDGWPYMHRLELLWAKWTTWLINVMMQADSDARCHNHPWKWMYKIILSGGYWEEIEHPDGTKTVRKAPRFDRVPEWHRIIALENDRPVVTLFFGWHHLRKWGFKNPDGSIEIAE
jgi:hypothetical protein